MADDDDEEGSFFACVGDPRAAWLEDGAQYDLLLAGAAERLRKRAEAGFDVAELRGALDKVGKRKALKDSEKRKLRDRLRQAFSPGLETTAALDAVLPLKAAVSSARLGPTRHEVYFVDDAAHFLLEEPTGKGKDCADRAEFLPTPRVLRRCPHLVRQVAVHAPVRKNVCRGADLFGGGIVGASNVSEAAVVVARPGTTTWARELVGGAARRGEVVALVPYFGAGQLGPFPFAVGRFAKSDEDLVREGLRGVAVAVALHEGDALCAIHDDDEEGSIALALEAMRAACASRAHLLAAREAKAADREAAQAAASEAQQAIDDKRDRRKVEKLLRAIDDLKLKDLNAEQREKVDKEAMLRAQLAEIDAREARLAGVIERGIDKDAKDAAPLPDGGVAPPPPPVAAADDDPGEGGPAVHGEADDEATASSGGEEEEEQEEQEEDADDASQGEGVVVEEDVDARFTRAFLTTLRRDYGKKALPALMSEVFASAARRSGRSVKETRWKKASKFVEDLAPGLVVTKERRKGILELFDVDWAMAPPFEEVADAADGPAAAALKAATAALQATKRGDRVMVTCRKVRNKNCTFVDGLDAWGFTYDRQKLLAAAFAKRFSAATSVHERKGSKRADAQRKFWSVMVQGKYAAQIATALRRDHAVLDVQVVAGKGIITKKDRAANV